jgi:hypothetical protein
MLAIEAEGIGDFKIAADSATGEVKAISLTIGGTDFQVTIAEIDQLPIQIADYPVIDDGEYSGGGDANQDW